MDTSTLFSLQGRTALVTGGSRGIGKMIAAGFIAQGAKVYISSRKADVCDAVAEELGPNCISLPQDVSTVEGCQMLADAYFQHEKSLDILVNNAGVGGARRKIEDITEDIYNQMFEVHVRGTFFATQTVLPGMKEKKDGKVINISSIYAMGGSQLASHYAASKAAISGFTKSWARELAPWRIKVNAVAPGFIVTGMTQGSNPPEKIAEREKLMPLGEFCKPIDISYAVAWLASAETDLVSGQVISPNSGEVIVGY